MSLLLSLICSLSPAQINLVPNGSFEDTTFCPTTLTQINASTSWSSVNIIGTPDYYNTCSSTLGIAPPTTFFTYQHPLTGNAFAGLVTAFFLPANPDYREFIGAQLVSSLQPGSKYYVSFYANRGYGLAQHYVLASNKLGALFSAMPFSVANPAPENNFAHIYTDSIITDTLNWVQIKGSFIADSAYQYINIGNFFDNAHTDTMNFGDTVSYTAYYLIEDICVSIDSNLCNQLVNIKEDSNSKILRVYPNPANSLLTIELPLNSIMESSCLLIRDLLGKIIHSESIEINFSNVKINMSSFSNGIYFLEIKSAEGSLYKKILVSHY